MKNQYRVELTESRIRIENKLAMQISKGQSRQYTDLTKRELEWINSEIRSTIKNL